MAQPLIQLLSLLAILCGLATSLRSKRSLAGHRQPIGNHRPAELTIDEYTEHVSGEVFFERYVSRQKPVVFRNFVKLWPAFRKWTDDYLAKEYGQLEVKIEPKKDGSNFGAEGALGIGRDTIGNFARSFTSANKYIVSELPTPLYKDVLVSPSLTCGELRDSLVEIDLWWSGGGTRSRLHRDAYNAINCQVNGTKKWLMINNNETDNVYFVASSKWEMGGLSPINVDDVDLNDFPSFADVKYGQVTIEAGDCLFVPGGHYHQVKSTGDKNVAVSVLFGRIRSFNASRCKDHELKPEALDKLDVFWAWPGKGIKYMGRGDDNFFKVVLESWMDDEKRLTKKRLKRKLVTDEAFEPADVDEMANAMLQIVDQDSDNVITVDDINATKRFDWRNFSYVLEGDADLQNGYEFEFGVVDYSILKDMLDTFARSDSPTSEEKFLSTYRVAPVYGSTYRGKELFAKLDKDKNGYLSNRELNEEDVAVAMEPYEIGYEGTGGLEEAEDDSDEESRTDDQPWQEEDLEDEEEGEDVGDGNEEENADRSDQFEEETNEEHDEL